MRRVTAHGPSERNSTGLYYGVRICPEGATPETIIEVGRDKGVTLAKARTFAANGTEVEMVTFELKSMIRVEQRAKSKRQSQRQSLARFAEYDPND